VLLGCSPGLYLITMVLKCKMNIKEYEKYEKYENENWIKLTSMHAKAMQVNGIGLNL